jgi:WD40 repeat protein
MLIPILLITQTLAISYYTRITESNPITAVHFSPDSTLVAVGTTGTSHNIYSYSTLTVNGTYTSTAGVSCVKFSPSQQYLAFALSSTTVQILNISYSVIHTITSQLTTRIREVDFNSNSNRIIICGTGPSKLGY